MNIQQKSKELKEAEDLVNKIRKELIEECEKAGWVCVEISLDYHSYERYYVDPAYPIRVDKIVELDVLEKIPEESYVKIEWMYVE